ncbi:WD40-repeat-containing domain protein [Zopfochytrium polystomum]|nr:WD40-repeat-containing domain protein [Zopfochytrium polystomum]
MDAEKKETKLLKQRIEVLEKENIALKKSLYDLSVRFNMLGHRAVPFTIDSLDANGDLPPMESLLEPQRTRRATAFSLKAELKGHTGAVYTVEFSQCGRFLASGSFDKSVRIWETNGVGSTVGGVGTAGSLREVQGLRKHAVTISDVKWSSDSAELLSGGYDQTCKIWDVESGKMVDSYECEGFVQAVSFSPIDRNIMFYGTSRNVLGILDRRKPDAALTIRNDSMVNSLYVFPDAMSVLSADASGCLKTWDVRDGRSCHSFVNEPTKKPISHITVCDDKSDDGPRYLAVNSYDNVLRVYDRGFAPPDSSYRLLHALKGYKNKNWPIKSSFRRIKSSGSHGDIFAKADIPADTIDTIGDSDVLLATGSADPFVYLYQISSHGTSEFLQRLEGHTDRVYATSFHPTEPILASCSADFSVKLWYSGKSKRSS